MSKLHMDAGTEPIKPAALRLADLVCLGATPAFAVMAVISGMGDGGPTHAGHHGPSVDGMTLMYALMATFHSAPWLRLASGRRGLPAPCCANLLAPHPEGPTNRS